MSNISLRPSRDSSNPSSNRMLTFPRFPLLRMGSRVYLEDGSRATIVGTGNIVLGSGVINLFYIAKADIAAALPTYILVNVENIDGDGRFVK